ncbi:uncharacterized protein LOC103846234 [Brassica rapa]|uniref:uncharacterized protein LOC103846234 n=1 Tax=Brassica campestris TaxID=3711 RepID=UPI00142E03B4|nr:uncharacterized protein LOC103846234 [Brassica rapa]
MAALNTLASEGDGGDASESDATAALSIQALGVIGIATEPAAEEMTKQGNEAIVDGKRQSDGSPRSAPWVKKKMGGGEPEAIVDVVDGVASLQIPEEIFDEAELLWKSYVGGFISLEMLLMSSNNLYSHKGLKCLSKAVGQFVKLHPSTEKCVRLDVARALVSGSNFHGSLLVVVSVRRWGIKVRTVRDLEALTPVANNVAALEGISY